MGQVVKALVRALVLAAVMSISSISGASALPPERHYEMVSPQFKGGYGVSQLEAAAPSGGSVAYDSLGAFAGAPANHVSFGFGSTYLAVRHASGWSTEPLVLPASVAPYSSPAILDFSSTLEQSLFIGQVGPNAGAGQFESTEAEFFLHPSGAPDTKAGLELVGEVLKIPAGTALNYGGASASLSHIIVEPPEGVTLTAEASGVKMSSSIYDLSSGGGGCCPLRFVGLNNDQAKLSPIDASCKIISLGALAIGNGGKDSSFNALADDGQEIFFWTCAGSPTSKQVFVRLEGLKTLEVSRPLGAGQFGGCVGEASPHTAGEVPCEGAATRPDAEFAGASQDGSRVLFLTTAKLVAEDTDTANDLYMAKIGCPGSEPECEVAKKEVTELVRLPRALGANEAAEVQGVMAVSPDATHVYFVARGVLSPANGEGQVPFKGADNLYVYDDTAGTTTFIADLCSTSVHSGEREDVHCPTNLESLHGKFPAVNDVSLWKSPEAEVQTADNGRFVVFSSYGQLTSDDTDNARDVFLYDAQSATLRRVSVGEAGYDSNGNREDEPGKNNADVGIVPTFVQAHASVQAELGSRAINEEGTRILLVTSDPLSPAATNGLVNIYEWHDGVVSLVSSGSDEQPIGQAGTFVITPSGNDIFFTTVQKLLLQDTDEAPDVYDARFGAGFAPPPASTQACAGDACQGPLTNPAPLLIPGSVSQAAGENAISTKAIAKKKTKPRKKGKKSKAKRASSGRRGARKANGRGSRR